MIKCTECDHENEAQRVYCHNCGARLDRSALVEEAQKPKKVVKQKKKGEGIAFGKNLATLFKVALAAFVAAAVVEAIRPPEGVPQHKQVGDDFVDSPSISVDLEEALISPKRIGYTAAQLNEYLKNRVKAPKDPVIPSYISIYDSSFVNLAPESLRLTKCYRVFTLPVYVGGTYLPTADPGGLTMKNLGGNLGRLPISPVLFSLVDDYIFAEFKKNLSDEAANVGKMKAIQVTSKGIILTSGPKK